MSEEKRRILDMVEQGTITQEEAQRQATLLDMLSRFIVSLFR